MERDFLGLHSKDPVIVFKEEVNINGYKEIGRPGFEWPFSEKFSAVPHLMGYSFGRGDKTKRLGFNSLVYPGFMPLSTPDAAQVQKLYNPNKQVGNHFSLAATPNSFQHDVQCPYDINMYPVSNKAISSSLTHPYMKNNFATASRNSPIASVMPQLLGGIPVTTSHSILPTFGSVVGSTEAWKNVRVSESTAQLTIFYAGTLNVYEDITPEKAQAIMFLAGNGTPFASNVTHSEVVVQTPTSKPVQVHSIPAGFSTPLSVSSHTGAQSDCGSTSTQELMVYNTPISKMEPPKLLNTVGPVSAVGMTPSIPQARKASLARFLEKRKERVMNTAPYSLSKKYLDCGTAESNA